MLLFITAATVLGQIWADPNNPQATRIKFPEKSVVIKTLFATASVEQIPSQRGAPEWEAVSDHCSLNNDKFTHHALGGGRET